MQNLDPYVADVVANAVQKHLDELGGQEPANVYRIVLDEVERPMLEIMMRHTHGNQSRAAQCLGIDRATLRTKLKRHNLM